MATIVSWPYSIVMVIVFWLILSLIKRLSENWPKRLRVIDLITVPIWWSLETMTFQMTHFSIVGPMLCMFLIWGIALAIYQTYGTQQFVVKRFLINWWRLVSLITLIIYGIVIVFSLWQMK